MVAGEAFVDPPQHVGILRQKLFNSTSTVLHTQTSCEVIYHSPCQVLGSRITGKVAPSTATVPERDVKRILPVLNREVPENFGYSGAYQVWPVEPSFIVRKRLDVRGGDISSRSVIPAEYSIEK